METQDPDRRLMGAVGDYNIEIHEDPGDWLGRVRYVIHHDNGDHETTVVLYLPRPDRVPFIDHVGRKFTDPDLAECFGVAMDMASTRLRAELKDADAHA